MLFKNVYFWRKNILDHIQHNLDPNTHILDQNHNFGRRNFMKINWQIKKMNRELKFELKYFRSDSTFFNSKNFQNKGGLRSKKLF